MHRDGLQRHLHHHRRDGEQELGSGEYTLELAVDGNAVSCAYSWTNTTNAGGSGVLVQCSPTASVSVNAVTIRTETRHSGAVSQSCVPAPGYFTQQLAIRGTPARSTSVVRRDGALLGERSFTPRTGHGTRTAKTAGLGADRTRRTAAPPCSRRRPGGAPRGRRGGLPLNPSERAERRASFIRSIRSALSRAPLVGASGSAGQGACWASASRSAAADLLDRACPQHDLAEQARARIALVAGEQAVLGSFLAERLDLGRAHGVLAGIADLPALGGERVEELDRALLRVLVAEVAEGGEGLVRGLVAERSGLAGERPEERVGEGSGGPWGRQSSGRGRAGRFGQAGRAFRRARRGRATLPSPPRPARSVRARRPPPRHFQCHLPFLALVLALVLVDDDGPGRHRRRAPPRSAGRRPSRPTRSPPGRRSRARSADHDHRARTVTAEDHVRVPAFLEHHRDLGRIDLHVELPVK